MASSDTSVRWNAFSEASNCGEPYTRPPYMSKTGSISDTEPILGPFGTYFGRNLAQVRARLVPWTVPGSGGQRVLVHREALPAFRQVAENLAGQAAAGRVYRITSVSSFVARTLRGSHQLSRHALGTAIDINYSANPYREDGTLVTNMPTWFVEAWTAAGFCWGGDWLTAKDPMHFSWLGPAASGTRSLTPTSPATVKRPFDTATGVTATIFAPVMSRYTFTLADGSGNGAPDVIGSRPHPDGTVIDIATGNSAFGDCSISRWFLPSRAVAGADHLLWADFDADSGQDLIALETDGGEVIARVASRREGFEDVSLISTGLLPGFEAVTAADFDGDRRADLWTVDSQGTLRVHGGESWTELLHQQSLPHGAPLRIAAADRDGGDLPELFALYRAGQATTLEVLTLDQAWVTEQQLPLGFAPGSVMALGAIDYDGDGRADLEILDARGRLHAYLGNSPTGRPASSWFLNPDRECPEDPVRLVFEGTFFDDDASVHQANIETIAAAGITLGCNPPFGDMFCPRRDITRAQAAAFLARALHVSSDVDFFTDDDGHTLEESINAIAAAGITLGCNPPANDRFCPNQGVTRAQFAAFLARALELPPTRMDFFTDDDGLTLEGDINRLAAAGIAKGCDPPDNHSFCPSRINTRAEAASFLTRGLGIGN
jgi:hypothetical protein